MVRWININPHCVCNDKNWTNWWYMPFFIGERIRALRIQRNFSLDDLARSTGLTGGFIGRLERGEERYTNPKIDTIQIIADALGVNIGELMTGSSFGLPVIAEEAPSFILNDIPEINLSQAGRRTFFDSNGLPVGTWPKKYHRPNDVTDPHAYIVRVDGDSMEPVLKKGNRLLCVTNEQAQNGDLVVAQLYRGAVVAKELSLKNENFVVLKSINPLYDPIVVTREEIRAIHPVVWIKRR